jgi:hypothetical protein
VPNLPPFDPVFALKVPGRRGRSGPSSRRMRFATESATWARVMRNAGGTQQVVVRITSKGYTHGRAQAHAAYLIRQGKLTGEDENGFSLLDRESVLEKVDGWRLSRAVVFLDDKTHLPPEQRKKLRQTLHIVFSMPKGTDPLKVLQGVRQLAALEFAKHERILVLHDPATDPSKHRGKNPHVHVLLKALSTDGRRLQVDKADLFHFRQAFAEQMRALGVEANASSRLERAVLKRPESLASIKMWKRLVDEHGSIDAAKARMRRARELPDLTLPPAANVKQAFDLVRSGYLDAIGKLSQSQREEHLKAALVLRHYVEQFPILRSTREQIDKRVEALRDSLSTNTPGQRKSRGDERTR